MAPPPQVAASAAPAPVVASAPVLASAPVVAQAPAASAAPVPAAAKPAAKPAAAPAEEPGFFASLIENNPLALAGGGALVALLAGFGIYRVTRRAKKDSGETSFLESRLQPDSFFGASGGQRIDTREGGASSSMSYSLSQLDAIGDVDPVAEADVYLAYGRDLQAEEILKEALRSSPERLAIRTKLLEVYAKRRDTKGFELLATQLFALSRGEGEHWAKAQELGQQIDPDNPLYQPGGAPVLPPGASDRVTEPLGATTLPQSVLPTPSQYDAANSDPMPLDSSLVDLDLDLDVDAQPTVRDPIPPAELPRTVSDARTLEFESFPDLPTRPITPAPPPPAPPAADFPMDFDLSAISLDLEPTSTTPQALLSTDGKSMDSGFGGDDDGADPLARKLDLADEFRQIGDVEGARDLLQEVASKASGALKAKAQAMLDELG